MDREEREVEEIDTETLRQSVEKDVKNVDEIGPGS